MPPSRNEQATADLAAVVADVPESLHHAVAADRVARLASALSEGMGPGGVVAVLSESSMPALELLWAARKAGLILLAFDPSMSLEEIAYAVNDSGARAIAASSRFSDVATSLVPLTPYVRARFAMDGSISDHRSLALARTTAVPYALTEHPVGTLHYSATATGRPTPFAALDPLHDEPGREELCSILSKDRVDRLGPHTVLLTVCAVSDPVSAQLMTAVYAVGGTVVTLAVPSPEHLLQAIATYRPTLVHLSPGTAVGLAKLPAEARGLVGTSVDLALLSSPSCPRDVLLTLTRSWQLPVRQLYLAPSVGVVTAIEGSELGARPGSVGRETRTGVSIVGEDGQLLPRGSEGMVRVSRKAQVVTLVDRGYIDEEGYLYLSDRDSFQMEAGGEFIAPRDLENILITHPAVSGVAVLGVTHRVVAFVELADGVRPGPEVVEELTAHLRGRVPASWFPRRIDFTDRLPRTASGKLDKRRLAPRDALGVVGNL